MNLNLNPLMALYLSLAVIMVYWVYQIFNPHTQADLPGEFSAFVGRIALVKLAHMAAMFLLLRVERAGWSELGLHWEKWRKQLLAGLGFGFMLFVLFNVALGSVLSSLFPKLGDFAHSILDYFDGPENLVIWLVMGIVAGGLVEELVRVFMLTRFEKAFEKPGLYLALVISSVVFGIGHLYQGTGAAISTGIYGLVIGIIFIRRRSAIEVITAHAFSDILAILAAYILAGYR